MNDRWDWFWSRHATPASGWSRVPLGPLLVYAVYRRNGRLLVAGVLFALLNPILFPATDGEGWMARGVQGERLWLEQGRPLVGTDYPELLNVGSALATAWALYAAIKRRPAGATVATALFVSLKLLFVHEVGEHYARHVQSDG